MADLLESQTVCTIEAKLSKHWDSIFGLGHIDGWSAESVEGHESDTALDVVLSHPIQDLCYSIIVVYHDLEKASSARHE